jgi:toluene monooxygenase system protein D
MPAPDRDAVGPVLERGGLGEAVAAAIHELQPEAVILDRGAYLRVSVPRRCRVTREAIARHAGVEVRLPGDLERVMPSFKGRFRVSEEEASWALE